MKSIKILNHQICVLDTFLRMYLNHTLILKNF